MIINWTGRDCSRQQLAIYQYQSCHYHSVSSSATVVENYWYYSDTDSDTITIVEYY